MFIEVNFHELVTTCFGIVDVPFSGKCLWNIELRGLSYYIRPYEGFIEGLEGMELELVVEELVDRRAYEDKGTDEYLYLTQLIEAIRKELD